MSKEEGNSSTDNILRKIKVVSSKENAIVEFLKANK